MPINRTQLSSATPTELYGPPGGHGTLLGTAGDDDIHASGPGNSIATGGGRDVVWAGTGGATVYAYLGAPGTNAAMPLDGGQGLSEVIYLAGTGNAVYGGSEDFSVSGGTGGNTVAVGFGNHAIDLFGAGNTVTLGAGTSMLRFTGGSASVTLTDFAAPPPSLYNLTLMFAGTGNTLVNTAGAFSQSGLAGDRGTLKITGGSGGGNFDLGWSTATLVTDGRGNVVHAGQGVSSIAPGSGGDTVLLETSMEFNQLGGDVTVTLAGTQNVVRGEAHMLAVTGGSGYSIFSLVGDGHYSYIGAGGIFQRSYSIVTAGLDNVFTLDGTNSNTITAGYGHDSVTIRDPETYGVAAPLVASSIVFSGTNNTLVAGDASVNVTGGTGWGSFTLGDGADSITTRGPCNTITAGNGTDVVTVAGDQTWLTLGDGDDTITLSGTAETVAAGDGNDVFNGPAGASHITAGDGSDVFLLTGGGNVLAAGNGDDSFTLMGFGNVVLAGDGDDTVTGGRGQTSVTLGGGQNNVTLGGWGNCVTLGAGFDTVDGGLGFTTIAETGSFAELTLHGRGDVVTLNAGSTAEITDQSSDLLLKLTSGDATALVLGFGAATGAKLDLVGGVGGFANAQQVLAALQDDGQGGTLLSLGGGGSVDLFGVAPGQLHAGNFLFQ